MLVLWNPSIKRSVSILGSFEIRRPSVYATIQREEVCQKVMINDATAPEARVYSANASLEKKPYKGKHSDMKCGHCNVPGHSVDRS
nr:hypothetical protein [Tanacetum cinerariifolium]